MNHQAWWLPTPSEVRDSGFGHLQLLLIYEQLSRRVKVVFPKRKKLLKLRIKMTKCIIYKGLKKVPDPPLKVSRRQPSAVWSGAQQTPTRSTWQAGQPALLSIPRALLRKWLQLPIYIGQLVQLVQMGPNLQVCAMGSAK